MKLSQPKAPILPTNIKTTETLFFEPQLADENSFECELEIEGE